MDYAQLCKSYKLPLMMQAWWLDAVCPGEWDAMLYEQGETVKASFVYHLRRKWGLRFILQPQLTQYSGLWTPPRPPAACDYKHLTEEKQILNYFLDRIQQEIRPHYTEINLHHSVSNHLPFLWHGYKQTTRYTYVIDHFGNIDKTYRMFSSNKRRNIHKATGKFTLSLGMQPDEFYALHIQSLATKHKGKILYPYQLFQRLWKASTTRRQGQIFALYTPDHKPAAAYFVVWDRHSAYGLMHFVMPEYASSGASSLIVLEILKYLAGRTRAFDFEGSIDEGIEHSYRQFATRQKPYHHLTRLSFL